MTIHRCGGFPAWRVLAGILHNFLHLRVRKNVFDKNPQQPTTPSNPPQAAGEFLFLRGAILGTWLQKDGRRWNGPTIALLRREFTG